MILEQFKKGIDAFHQLPADLDARAFDQMHRDTPRRTVGQVHRRVIDLERFPWREEPHPVDQRATLGGALHQFEPGCHRWSLLPWEVTTRLIYSISRSYGQIPNCQTP